MKPAKSTKQKRLAKKRAKLLSSSKPKKDQKPFPFLSLPAELRDCIYELALVEPEGVTLVSKTKAYRRTVARGPLYNESSRYRHYGRRWRPDAGEAMPQMTGLVPNLLAVNKQIHDEAIGYLYQQPIVLEDTMTLHTFIAAIGSNRSQLTNLVLRSWGFGRGTHKAMNFASLTILASCTNLKSLAFECNIGWIRMPKQLARQLYRDGHYFLEAYGAANGAKDAALKILKLGDTNYAYTRASAGAPDKTNAEKCHRDFEEEMRKLLGM